MKVQLESRGSFKNIERFLKVMKERRQLLVLDKYGQMGLEALKSATPIRTGKTAASWSYEIGEETDHFYVTWTNTNVVDNQNIAIIVDKGHGTKRGSYVQGKHYIDPAIAPIMDELARELWEEVKNA